MGVWRGKGEYNNVRARWSNGVDGPKAVKLCGQGLL
jgi:hypothetical protein